MPERPRSFSSASSTHAPSSERTRSSSPSPSTHTPSSAASPEEFRLYDEDPGENKPHEFDWLYDENPKQNLWHRLVRVRARSPGSEVVSQHDDLGLSADLALPDFKAGVDACKQRCKACIAILENERIARNAKDYSFQERRAAMDRAMSLLNMSSRRKARWRAAPSQ